MAASIHRPRAVLLALRFLSAPLRVARSKARRSSVARALVAGAVAVVLPLPLLLAGALLGEPVGARADTTGEGTEHTHRDVVGEVVREEVEFEAGERTVRGAVLAPEAAGEDRPGVVLVAGSGEGVPLEVYLPLAETFARAGIVTLVYDKRGQADGYGMAEASLPDLADDALAGVRLLRERPDVRADLVGVHGHSEGGWTVIEAGVDSSEVAFVMAAAPSALPPDRTQIWMKQSQLRAHGVAERLLDPLGARLTRHVVGAEAFRLAGHDPLPDLARLEQPFLAVMAEHDRSVPPGQTLELYRDTLAESGHPHHTLRVIEGAGHHMEPSEDGFVEEQTDLEGLFEHLVPEYVDTVTDWVHGLAAGEPAGGVDAAPVQEHVGTEQPPAGSAALWALIATFGITLTSFTVYLGMGLVGRLRGSRSRLPAPRAGWLVSVVGLLLPTLTVSYLGWIMVTAGAAPGPVMLDRPLPWWGLQLGALAVVAGTVTLLVTWWRRPGSLTWTDRIRLGLLLTGAMVLLSWALAWGLFTP